MIGTSSTPVTTACYCRNSRGPKHWGQNTASWHRHQFQQGLESTGHHWPPSLLIPSIFPLGEEGNRPAPATEHTRRILSPGTHRQWRKMQGMWISWYDLPRKKNGRGDVKGAALPGSPRRYGHHHTFSAWEAGAEAEERSSIFQANFRSPNRCVNAPSTLHGGEYK